ncbi:uncharacterized protein LOC115561364 isoform X2 [Gadus morhua]|uniref:uncharacterized protein LOC115561364 isoform X2 n=1 Tax=Gadus morhua TaxID=8049 RepID=UPI0011B7F82A|nr:uncharacterized protein LOC115561364 isoform X2 [Gadus morhua]
MSYCCLNRATMLKPKGTKGFWCLWVGVLVQGSNLGGNSDHQQRPLCHAGSYCPVGTSRATLCPEGSYGPSDGAVSSEGCLSCPSDHYCPRAGLDAPLPCGADAHQPLPGQRVCICLGEGQSFQTSDGQCRCALGYQPTNQRNVCVETLYDVCSDRKTRTQYGNCLGKSQWALHCSQQVCLSVEDYQGYDGELGVCTCREAPGRTSCGSLCRRGPSTKLMLQCSANGDLELAWRYDTHQASALSGSLLESVFKRWDSQGALLCQRLDATHSVHAVETTVAGFLGLLSGIPKELHALFPTGRQDERTGLEVLETDNYLFSNGDSEATTHGHQDKNTSDEGGASSNVGWGSLNDVPAVSGVMNPTACLQLGDVLLFTVTTHYYPQYDIANLFNTNRDFDWGVFTLLADELALSSPPPTLFPLVFSMPGTYVLKLSSNQYKHMYVRVMPAGGQCYEPEPFLETSPGHLTRVGIRRKHALLLRPDWAITGGLLSGAVLLMCLCVTMLVLFREYGWPEKKPINAMYRVTSLAYCMADYSSKGSRLTSFKRTHRNQQARETQDPIGSVGCAEPTDEFWDYEKQVDLEAFSTNTFYNLLLKQSLSVTSRLGQLTTEVKELYQGVLEKLSSLRPHLPVEERGAEGYDRLRREVEREAGRRQSKATQLRVLLDFQLQVLQQEGQIQKRVHNVFTARLKECTRLLARTCNPPQLLGEEALPSVVQRVLSLVEEMEELLSAESKRLGAWGMLGDGTGARLLCPDTGTVLTKEHIIETGGQHKMAAKQNSTLANNQETLYCSSAGRAGESLREGAVHTDAVTGLMRPAPNCHMLLGGGHIMPVPPDYFLHPHTGRVMPIHGNVAYDPACSALVCTTDLCRVKPDDNRKCEVPLLPFVPYPTLRHSNQPMPCSKLRGLRPGQRLQLGSPMADPVTGVPVPILGVTIHPQSGLVYPLGGLYACPLTGLRQHIQMGSPFLDPRTGSMMLTTGVSLDPMTGIVVPVGGVVLADSFMEPMSGRLARVGGASLRAGQMVPHAGGFQAFLDSKVLSSRATVLNLLKGLTEGWTSGSERGHAGSHVDHVKAAARDLEMAWGRSLHCLLQLQTRLQILIDWSAGLQRDGGTLGLMQLPGCDMCVTALLGLEYPDPMGSGLSVPVLGSQVDPLTGSTVPLAGTMEDPNGKGLVPIRIGALTVDPVTGVLAPVVGARLDMSRKNIVPVTVSNWTAAYDHTDTVQMEALQKEVFLRSQYWQQQGQREEKILSDLDMALLHFLGEAMQAGSAQTNWTESGRCLREVGVELQDDAQCEAQRRVVQVAFLSLLLPTPVLHILTQGDEEEWELQCVWHSQLMSCLDSIEVTMEQLHCGQEKHFPKQDVDWDLRQKELSQQFCSRQAEVETVLSSLQSTRHLSLLRSDTAQAVLGRKFWYKHYGLPHHDRLRSDVRVVGLAQQKALPILERLRQLLEDKQPMSLSPSTYWQHIGGLSTKQAYGLEMSRAWTASVPVVKGISSQSLREQIKSQSQDSALPASPQTNPHTASSGNPCQENQPMKACGPPTHVCVPTIAEEEWDKLLQRSPLFQLLRKVELGLKEQALDAGFLKGELRNESSRFVDVLDAQWACEGELIPLDVQTLNPREFLAYQHGLFLLKLLHTLKLGPGISLQVAASLPHNNYADNAFRNSFFYQDAEDRLFVRRQRLQCVGGFSLLLLHCLSHISVGDMSSDSSPAFQRLFFKSLQVCLGELFQARLGKLSSGQDAVSGAWSPCQGDFPTTFLIDSHQTPSRGVPSQHEETAPQKNRCEESLFNRIQELLREKH